MLSRDSASIFRCESRLALEAISSLKRTRSRPLPALLIPQVGADRDGPPDVDARMWNKDILKSWLARMAGEHGDFLGHDEWRLRNELKKYPPLYDSRDPDNPAWDHASWIAHEAAARARSLAEEFYLSIPDYTHDLREFSRWLENVGYRQALRLVLTVERVEAELAMLPIEQRRLLYWRYVDRWTDAEVAHALRFTLSPATAITPQEARKLSTAAYRALCTRLRRSVPVGTLEVTTFFPIFPGGEV